MHTPSGYPGEYIYRNCVTCKEVSRTFSAPPEVVAEGEAICRIAVNPLLMPAAASCGQLLLSQAAH
jgi:hypothetical protein